MGIMTLPILLFKSKALPNERDIGHSILGLNSKTTIIKSSSGVVLA